MSTWRMAGLNYVNYSNIAAKVLRKALKADKRGDALKRDESSVRCFFWENGEVLPLGQKPSAIAKEAAAAAKA